MQKNFIQTLLLIRGKPGSGKSTLAKTYVPYGFVHFESDEWHYNNLGYVFEACNSAKSHIWCQLNTENLIRKGKNVVVSNVFIKLIHIVPYYDIAVRYRVNFQVITADGNYKDIHNVPEATLKQMAENFEEYSFDKIKELHFSYKDPIGMNEDFCESKK